MELDDELCLCFHVTKRKVVNFIAGTGCGWCRPFLQRLLEQSAQQIEQPDDGLPDTDTYASGRQQHRKNKGLT